MQASRQTPKITPICILIIVLTAARLSLADDGATTNYQPNATLASKLADAKHISLSREDSTIAYTIRVYSAEQQRRNLEKLSQTATDIVTSEDLVKSLNSRAKAAKENKAPAEEQKAIARELSEVTKTFARNTAPPIPFFYYRVLSVGQDFIELKPETGRRSPGSKIIISLRYVHKIIVEPPDEPVTPAPNQQRE